MGHLKLQLQTVNCHYNDSRTRGRTLTDLCALGPEEDDLRLRLTRVYSPSLVLGHALSSVRFLPRHSQLLVANYIQLSLRSAMRHFLEITYKYKNYILTFFIFFILLSALSSSVVIDQVIR